MIRFNEADGMGQIWRSDAVAARDIDALSCPLDEVMRIRFIFGVNSALRLLTFRESHPIGALVDGHAVRRSLWKPCLRQ